MTTNHTSRQPHVSRKARRQLARVTGQSFVPRPNPGTAVVVTTPSGKTFTVAVGRDVNGVPAQRASALRSYRGAYARHANVKES